MPAQQLRPQPGYEPATGLAPLQHVHRFGSGPHTHGTLRNVRHTPALSYQAVYFQQLGAVQCHGGGRGVALGTDFDSGQLLHLRVAIGLNNGDFGYIGAGAGPAAAYYHEVAAGRGRIGVKGPRTGRRQAQRSK